MTLVPPYHSAKHPGVYHVRTDCPDGKHIEEENRARGSGRGRLCEHCDRLRKEGRY